MKPVPLDTGPHDRNSLGYIIGRQAWSSEPQIVWGRAWDGSRVHIESARSSAIDKLRCECDEFLVAKKGQQRAHHFAHQSGAQTACRAAKLSATSHFVIGALSKTSIRLPILNERFRFVGISECVPYIAYLYDALREPKE